MKYEKKIHTKRIHLFLKINNLELALKIEENYKKNKHTYYKVLIILSS